MEENKVIDLLCERVMLDDNDPSINDIWDKLTEYLSEDVEETINFLDNCPENQLYYISEIFEDISYNLKSERLIQELHKLNRKYPNLQMELDIKSAEECLEW